jgi:hypothetical protein
MQEKENKFFEPFEPKKENRFLVKFPEPFKIPQYVIHKANRPSFSITEYGTIIWKNITFSLYDPISPSTSGAIMEGLKELRKKDSQKLTIEIEILDPTGNVVESWNIHGNIDNINFGILDWSKGEPLYITIEFKVEYAQLNF